MCTLAREDTGRTPVPRNGLDADALAGSRHPDLAIDRHIGGDNAERVPRFVCPDKDTFTGRIDQLLLALRREPVLLYVVLVRGLIDHCFTP